MASATGRPCSSRRACRFGSPGFGSHHRARPDAALGVDGRWLLQATDLGAAWLVEASGPEVRTAPVDPPATAAASLTGAGAELLAFLLGRLPVDSLDTTGDARLAAAFKRAFPGP